MSRGIAAQLTATNGPVRPEAACSTSATSSLPDPVSPMTRTGAVVRAATEIMRRRPTTAGDSPMILSRTTPGTSTVWSPPQFMYVSAIIYSKKERFTFAGTGLLRRLRPLPPIERTKL